MNFTHTQDDLDLRDGAREFLRGQCTVEKLRKLKENETADLGLWSSLAELGLLGFLASEQNGGLGMDQVGFALIAEEAGYVALPEPMTDVAGVCLPLLDSLQQPGLQDLCEELAGGQSRLRSVHASNPYVNQLADDDRLLLLSDDTVRLLDAGSYQRRGIDTIDPLRRLSEVSVDAAAGKVLLEDSQAAELNTLGLQHGALFSAAELLGLSAAMIDMATEYAKERQQFGKVIGSYQAVKHHLATAFVGLEFARPAVYRASSDLASANPKTSLSIAHAKIAATDAAIKAAEVAIQVYGGMGYTFEVDLHLWMKRAWALAGQWGSRGYHMQVVEQALFTDKLPLGPAQTFAQH